MKHILIIASYGPSLVNFRISLIKDLLNKGHKVSVACPKKNFSFKSQKKLKEIGVKIIFFSISRTGLNFFKDLRSIFEIYKIINKSKPDIVMSYTLKVVIYSGMVLNFFSQIYYYPLITGLGATFTEVNTVKKKLFRNLIVKLYKIGLINSKKVIFQNKDDLLLFLKLKIISKKELTKIVNGSGVDLKQFPISKLPSKSIFLMISRLLIDKGVREYVQAATIVKSQFPKAIFKLVGYIDENPSQIKYDELEEWISKGNIQFLGRVESSKNVLKSCKFFVLPSYREGTPRATLEALATGRPIITTDVPGCRETVVNNKNGFLVPKKDSKALATAMVKLLREKDAVVKKMAHESYLIAKNKYEIKKVNQSIMKIMSL